jgi:CBS domain-containing protein
MRLLEKYNLLDVLSSKKATDLVDISADASISDAVVLLRDKNILGIVY